METVKEFIITIWGLMSIVFLFSMAIWGMTIWVNMFGKFIDYTERKQ